MRLVTTISYLLIIYLRGIRATPTLTSNASSVTENGSFYMVCTTNLSYPQWYQNNEDRKTAVITFLNGSCEATSFIQNHTDLYDFSCYGNGRFTLILKNVQRDQHGDIWRCRTGSQRSNPITLNVSVPVANAWIQSDGKKTSMITVQENSSKQITCLTSYSRPRANITWYISDRSTSQNHTLPGRPDIEYRPDQTNGTLELTISNITLNLNRTYNGWNLVCTAKNIINYPAATTNATLNITYPTNKPAIQCTNNGNNGVYKVVQNSKGNVTCTVDGGNPPGRLHWNCSGDINTGTGKVDSVSTASLIWTAIQSQDCSCISSNVAGTRSESIKVDVLYPPVIIELKNTSVFEGDSVTLQCNVTRSNPPVNKIQWTSNKHTVNSSTLYLPNISRTEDRVYTCTAYNTMDPSCRDVVPGNTSRSLHLDVLYAPSINFTSETNVTVNEGDRFNYNCSFVPGNPPDTTVVWKTANTKNNWTSSKLVIQNVTRYDDAVYTCHVRNIMVDSNGKTKNGTDSADIRLIVHFKARIVDFYLHDYQHTTSVTVNENETLTFTCIIQSNPIADAKIYEMETLVNSSTTDELFYRTKAPCSGEPVSYSCHGANSLNMDKPSTLGMQLFVRCKPRRDTGADVQFQVAGATNDTVILSYTALAYPPPTFVWYKNDTKFESYGPRTFVSSSTLQTNLTITQLTEEDYGEYYLSVTNDVGTIKETFNLKAQGVPETPTSLTQDNTSTTDSIISLHWKPGFNNGLEQTFTIVYRQQNTDKWQSVNVQDTGSKTIHYNITGLSSSTNYEIVLFAFNDIGRSKSNVTLISRTKEKLQEPVASANSMIPVAVGVSVSVVAVTAVVIVAFVILKRRRKHSKPIQESQKLYVNVTKDNKKKSKETATAGSSTAEPKIYENQFLIQNKELQSSSSNNESGNSANMRQNGEVGTDSKARTEDKIPMKRMKADNSSRPQPGPPPVPQKNDYSGILCKVDDADDDEANVPMFSDENIYNNSEEKIERIKSIFVDELFDFVDGKTFNDFNAEFAIQPKGLTMPHTVALKPENIKLNRFNGIFPYDHSRVTLPSEADFFINACYIDGYNRKKAYIASLGPTMDTMKGFKNFWKMVWHEQTDIIVMLTNLREISGMKCEQYWPKPTKTIAYGDVTVASISVEVNAEYTVRTFNVTCGPSTRILTQLHFTAWPDKKVPYDVISLLEFRQRIRSTPSLETGPIIVHCSAGIGRTGTLIALDRLIEEGKATKSINVSNCVLSMRSQRVNMVQTQEQYIYLYKALVYALAYECECIPSDAFHSKLKTMSEAKFSQLFEKLKITVDNDSANEKEAVQNNKLEKANRPNADVPGDQHRVKLYVGKGFEDSDYTNAVYVNGFKVKNGFIAAQTPLRDFVSDFICLVYQEQCVCVVDLDGNVPSKKDVGNYMPQGNQAFSVENFNVSCVQLDSNPKFTVSKLVIEKTGKDYAGEVTSYHFKYHDWKHGKETPNDAVSFVELIKEVDQYAKEFWQKDSHILVHCLDASSRSAFFCFVECLFGKMEGEKQVNVGNTLRQVRTRRKSTVKSPIQLKFSFKAVDAFLSSKKDK